MNIKKLKKIISPKNIVTRYIYLSIILFIFTFIYINKTAVNVIFMDEPRLITTLFNNKNIDISELWSASANGSQRILGYYTVLLINANYIGLNVKLNMYIGSFFILLSSILFIKHFKNRKINHFFLLCIPLILFSLDKWEFLTIGSSITQFIAIFIFYLHFITIDNFYINNENTIKNKILLNLLPSINILFFTGGYGALYAISTLICYSAIFLLNRNNKAKTHQLIINIISLLVPILIYSIGLPSAQGDAITKFALAFFQNPIYYFKFFFISLTGCIIGIETISKYFNTTIITIFGIFTFILYISTLYIYFHQKIYKKTFLPFLLIIFSITASIIITYSRSNFDSIIYGASSRYSPVYEMGIIGIIITYANIESQKKHILIIETLIILLLVLCNLFTTIDEIIKSPYRFQYFQEMKKIGLNYKKETDQNLNIFQSDPYSVRKALEICQKNKWNIFKNN